MELFYGKVQNGEFVPSNKKERAEYLMSIEGKSVMERIERTTGERTADQNSALHLYFTRLAQVLNDAGLSVKDVLSKKVDIDWTPYRVKENLWKDFQVRMYGKTSTKKLAKVGEIENIHQHITRFLGETWGIENPEFPNDPNKVR